MPLIPYFILMKPILGVFGTPIIALLWHFYGLLAFDLFGVWNLGSIKERTGMELIYGYERLNAIRSKQGINNDMQLVFQMDRPEGSLEDFN